MLSCPLSPMYIPPARELPSNSAQAGGEVVFLALCYL
jgi:hypothetical protein